MSEQPKEHYRYLRGIEACVGAFCMLCKDAKFIDWIDSLKRVLIVDYNWPEATAVSLDEEAYREMFDDGLSVDEAIYEDMTAG